MITFPPSICKLLFESMLRWDNIRSRANNFSLPEGENLHSTSQWSFPLSLRASFISHDAVTQWFFFPKLYLFVSLKWIKTSQIGSFGQNLLFSRITILPKNLFRWTHALVQKVLHGFIFAGGTIRENFVSKFKMPA